MYVSHFLSVSNTWDRASNDDLQVTVSSSAILDLRLAPCPSNKFLAKPERDCNMPPAPGSPSLLFPLDARQIEEAQMTRFKLLLFVAVFVGFAAPAYAGYDEGKAAYDRGDYAKAYK